MERRSLALLGMYALIAGVVACSSSKPATPVAPSNLGATAAPDGSTLKVTAATIQSPTNDQKLTNDVILLTAGPAIGQFASSIALQYRFQVTTSTNTLVQEGLVSATNFQVTAKLLPNTRYAWRVRPEYQGEAGPWSGTGSFITRQPFPRRSADEWHDRRQTDRWPLPSWSGLAVEQRDGWDRLRLRHAVHRLHAGVRRHQFRRAGRFSRSQKI